MKNQKLEMNHPAMPDGVKTEHLIKEVLNNPPVDGFTYEDFKARRRIEDAVDKAIEKGSDVIEFEDADAKQLQQCLSQMKWKFRHKEIEDFCEAVENMKDKE